MYRLFQEIAYNILYFIETDEHEKRGSKGEDDKCSS